MDNLLQGGWSVMFAVTIFWIMFIWVLFLIFDYRRRTEKPSFGTSIMLFAHMWLAILFLVATKIAESHCDPFLVWFVFLIIFRYYKTVINIFFYFRYKPAIAPDGFALSSMDCTVIVPTLGPDGNDAFAEMVSGILYNEPPRLIFSTATEDEKKKVQGLFPHIERALAQGTSTYQKERGLPRLKHKTDIRYHSANVANKREQFIQPLHMVNTPIVISADDSAIWHPKFLSATLPAFAEEKVGLVGTRKWVKYLPRPKPDPELSLIRNKWNRYEFGFWNAIGAAYLLRHNFEARATNAADGGVFCISGRTFLIRSEIIQDEEFQHAFLNEYLFPWWGSELGLIGTFLRAFLNAHLFPLWRGGVGPISADDDMFLSRWVLTRAGKEIRFQYTGEATMTAVLGAQGRARFTEQCKRWSRTTFRQFPQVLFLDRTVWWTWPLTVWTTFFPWLYNAALVWDPLLLTTFLLSKFYQSCEYRGALLAGLLGVIWASKLIKLGEWFSKHPRDFFMYYFPVPMFLAFVYGHSVLKICTAVTFYDLKWSGRELPVAAEEAAAKKKKDG